MSRHTLFASCPLGLETWVARELLALGAERVREAPAGVHVLADSETMYRIGYSARLPSRWLLSLAEGQIDSADALYALARTVPWHEHFAVEQRFALQLGGRSSRFADTRFALLKVKDAIVDAFRERCGTRPAVDTDQPDVRIHLALRGDRAALALDLVGAPLHQRGYRVAGHAAPLKENLAAALLVRAGWPERSAGATLLDPFCGGGTLLIEALWMAAGVPAQYLRTDFAWSRWRGHDAALWSRVRAEIDASAAAGLRALTVRVLGSDCDPAAIDLAKRQLQAARVASLARLECVDAAKLEAPAGGEAGYLVANLPYGERLGRARELAPLYRAFGERLQTAFAGWRFGLLCGDEELARATGLRADRAQRFRNGQLECVLLTGTVRPKPAALAAPVRFRSPGAAMVYNRILKNHRKLKSWLAREGIEAWRAYDADIPEYAAAIDVYGNRLCIQEYAPPPEVPAEKAAERLQDLVIAARRAFDVPSERVYLKQRRVQRPDTQYRKQGQTGEFFTVREGGARYLVNLSDYLDSGLFLDGRLLRAWIRAAAAGQRFLNLFCYTGTATVAAALGGAERSVSVDLSPTYLHWAERNFHLNGLDPKKHRVVEADAVRWLSACRETFDLIYLDPPSFSNSKRTPTVFDVQRDHAALIEAAMARLTSGGVLYFVCNLRRFQLHEDITQRYRVEDRSAPSIPPDFARNPKIHRAYRIQAR